MVNSADHVFIEKNGFLEVVKGVSLGDKALMICQIDQQPSTWVQSVRTDQFSSEQLSSTAESR
jgi:hypothetical protein